MSDITKQNISAKNVELSLSILPLLPYLSLSSGISEEGVQWEDIEVANYKQGADGLVGINTKPIVYTGTLNLMANSSQRKVLNDILQLTIPRPGIKLVEYELVLTELNYMLNRRIIYSGGVFTNMPSGNNYTKEDGQQTIVYKWLFQEKIIMSL